MTNRQLKIKAEAIKISGTYMTTSGNTVWKHEFYKMSLGNIMEISYINGKLVEIQNLGR